MTITSEQLDEFDKRLKELCRLHSRLDGKEERQAEFSDMVVMEWGNIVRVIREARRGLEADELKAKAESSDRLCCNETRILNERTLELHELRERVRVLEGDNATYHKAFQEIESLPILHDEKGHAWKRINCRSIFDLGAAIAQLAREKHPGAALLASIEEKDARIKENDEIVKTYLEGSVQKGMQAKIDSLTKENRELAARLAAVIDASQQALYEYASGIDTAQAMAQLRETISDLPAATKALLESMASKDAEIERLLNRIAHLRSFALYENENLGVQCRICGHRGTYKSMEHSSICPLYDKEALASAAPKQGEAKANPGHERF